MALADVLRHPRYEVFPLPGVETDVIEHARHAKITITASPRRGMAATLRLAEALRAHDVTVVPHLSARLIMDAAHLKEILDEVVRLGITEVFVVAGDANRPVGSFAGSLDLLLAMDRLGYDLQVGITGYPETHPKINDDVTVQSMWDKRHYASYVVSQICFDPNVILRWAQRVRARGVTLPIFVGVPGPVATHKLLGISRRVGVGESLRYVARRGRMGSLRLMRPGEWRPETLLEPLGGHYGDPHHLLHGLHFYTFNAVASTERWRQATLARTKQGS